MIDHPYYPVGLELPGYHPPLRSFAQTTGVFFAICAALAMGMILYSGSVKHFTGVDRALFCWWVLTGCIHFFLEGGFAIQPNFGQDTTGNLIAEMWKEYSKADSRYIARDSFIVGMETLTAFAWGPLSIVIARGMVTLSAWRFPLMIIVSLGQLYGCILYFATCILEGDIHSRPEPLYYWFYYVFMNTLWIVVPTVVLAYAWRKTVKGLEAAQGAKPAAAAKKRR